MSEIQRISASGLAILFSACSGGTHNGAPAPSAGAGGATDAAAMPGSGGTPNPLTVGGIAWRSDSGASDEVGAPAVFVDAGPNDASVLPEACVPKVCTPDHCGPIEDGCGALVGCGSCTAPQSCGALVPSVCGGCVPTTCVAAGRNCGPISDGCGSQLQCGTCTAPQVCGGSGVPSVCGTASLAPVTCSNFCQAQVTCSGGNTTSVTGTVYAPNGTLPIPNALVYVPNGSTAYPYGLTEFVDGVAGGACACDVSGSPLVSTTSAVDGTFTLKNVPAGSSIPVVIQLGRWRRVITVDVAACDNTTLASDQTRLPKRQDEGTAMDALPLIAITTGEVDGIECVLRKMGIEDSQFTSAAGKGRVRLYVDNGAVLGTTPSYRELTATQAEIDRYDAVLFACRGVPHDEPAEDKARVLDVPTNANAYVNKGGRAFFTHFSYAWLYNTQPSILLPWPSTTNVRSVDSQEWLSAVGQIDTSFAAGQTFATWLGLPAVNALSDTSPPRIAVQESARNLGNPPNGLLGLPARRWITTYRDQPADAVLQATFDTPWGLPPEQQCGRVVFLSFHVTSGVSNATTSTNGKQFPSECSAAFTPQEKVLAYDLFDLTNCVRPPPPPPACIPRTCAEQKISCGPAGDGCGGSIECGPCPPPPNCVPAACGPAQCGDVPDGCGGIVHCAPCPPNCTPAQCAPNQCGDAPDGCGATLHCRPCPCVPAPCRSDRCDEGLPDGCGDVRHCPCAIK